MTIFCHGQLPPGAAQAMAKEVKQWQESGLCSGVEISAGPGCDVAEAKKGKVYGFDDYPSLPLAGCRREPCCGCCYVPVVDDETRSEEPRREGMPLWKKILGILGSLWVIAVAASIFLSGCATTYMPNATAWIACKGKQCDALWSRAQVWLATNSSYRIQIANENIIQTYGPLEGVGEVAYTITREKMQGADEKIVIRGHCYSTPYGCFYDPAPATNALFNDLQK